ncbi:tyrosine-type recombinase/integrase [Mucilaginibacter ginkgonis]|uniref:Tyrosine-type recombinase/integrase n=1 Tax=Mucilaginibacter ginkgonis TaxID=2682091 RepID=A0A6I4HUH0_9SPHI|nr:tyrosine-type recombinase/integrase [Mucilaginibacter ginkgonis]QQL50258.1 tyrosine-type recombinase/integrase [Mucilaginibacter ginkgonis]
MLNLKQAITDFSNHCRYEKNLSLKSIRCYEIDLLQFTKFIEAQNFPSQINCIDKIHFKAYLKELSRWKPKTVKRKVATLKAMFNYLEFEDLIISNPLRKIKIQIKEPQFLPKALTLLESHALLSKTYDFLADKKRSAYSYQEALRNTAVIELLFATGARVSEISGLLHSSVDLESGLVTFFGKGGKQRMIQICNLDVLKILRAYCKHSKNNLSDGKFLLVNRLGNKLSDQSIRILVRNLASKANITKRVTPHMLRHTFATLLLENNVDIKYIQSMLGHSSIMTTQIYTHVSLEKQKQILADKHPRMNFSLSIP